MSLNYLTERPILIILTFKHLFPFCFAERRDSGYMKSELTLFCPTSQLSSQCYTPHTQTSNQLVSFQGCAVKLLSEEIISSRNQLKMQKYYHFISTFSKMSFINFTISALKLVVGNVKGMHSKMLKNDYNPTWRPDCYQDQ